MLKNNLRVYSINNVDVICADFNRMLYKRYSDNIIDNQYANIYFIDPPWFIDGTQIQIYH